MSEPREMARDARSDNPARFLRDLRQLRNQAGLDHAELAARAHYPSDMLSAAETGPSLPDLPVLSAYVRGCGGTPAEWEERWRSVTGRPASPLLTSRGSGWSEAANAGARVGAASAAADDPDPQRIRAALNRVADGMTTATTSPATSAGAPVPDLPAAGGASGDWDLASAAASDWDPAPTAVSPWEPTPKAPSTWRSSPEAHSVWDPAPKPDLDSDLTPAPSARAPVPRATPADHPATPATAPGGAAPRRTAPGGTSSAPAGKASSPRRPVSTRKLSAVLVVVTVALAVLTLVATVLAFA